MMHARSVSEFPDLGKTGSSQGRSTFDNFLVIGFAVIMMGGGFEHQVAPREGVSPLGIRGCRDRPRHIHGQHASGRWQFEAKWLEVRAGCGE
eukprot:2373366-Rhodomonas_salina.2